MSTRQKLITPCFLPALRLADGDMSTTPPCLGVKLDKIRWHIRVKGNKNGNRVWLLEMRKTYGNSFKGKQGQKGEWMCLGVCCLVGGVLASMWPPLTPSTLSHSPFYRWVNEIWAKLTALLNVARVVNPRPSIQIQACGMPRWMNFWLHSFVWKEGARRLEYYVILSMLFQCSVPSFLSFFLCTTDNNSICLPG